MAHSQTQDSTDSYWSGNYKPRLKICLSMGRRMGNVCAVFANLLVTDRARDQASGLGETKPRNLVNIALNEYLGARR